MIHRVSANWILLLLMVSCGQLLGIGGPRRNVVSNDPPEALQLERRKLTADSLSALGWRLTDTLHQCREAIPILNEALSLYHDIPDDTSAGNTLEKLGFAYRDCERYDSAIVMHERSLSIWGRLERKEDQARALNNIGEVYQYNSEYEKANDSFAQALHIAEELGLEEGQAALLTNIANNQSYLGQYQAANEKYLKALKLYRKLGNGEGEASGLAGLGFCAFRLKDYNVAEKQCLAALKIMRRLNLSVNEAATVGTLSVVYSAQGRKSRAMATAKSSRELARKIGDRLDEGIGAYKLGLISITMHRYREAIAYLRDAEVLFRSLRLTERQGLTYAQQMKAYSGLKNPSLAILCGKNAVNAFQGTRAKIRNLDRGTQKDFLATKEEAYRDLAALLIEEGRLAEAEIVLNMLKEDEYFDYLRASNTSASALRTPLTKDEVDATKERDERIDNLVELEATRSTLLTKAAKATITSSEKQKLDELDRKVRGTKAELEKFLNMIAQQATGREALRQAFAMEEAQSIQPVLRALGDETTAIYTLVGSSKYYALVVTPKARVPYSRRLNLNSLNQLMADFRRALSNPQMDPRAAGKQLYDILFRPLRKHLVASGARTIMWNLYGPLRYIPMAALYDGKQYLAEEYRHTMFTPSSIAQLKDLPSSRRNAVGLGVSQAHEGFRELPFVPRELGSIIRPMSEGGAGGILQGVIRLDSAFTYDTLQFNLKRRFSIVHLATHFEFGGDETQSYLLLGDGSHLSLERLHYGSDNVFDGVELLTLSACNTAMGSWGRGNEMESFAELAQNLGAKSVLASLWPVYDASTSIFMEQFYRVRESQPRKSKAEALQAAQLALLKGTAVSPEPVEKLFAAQRGGRSETGTSPTFFARDRSKPFAHPFYWAPFVLIGNWR